MHVHISIRTVDLSIRTCTLILVYPNMCTQNTTHHTSLNNDKLIMVVRDKRFGVLALLAFELILT